MNLLPLAQYLEGQGLGAVEQSIWVAQMPVECQTGILLRPNSVGDKINWEIPPYTKGHFKIVTRAKDFIECETLINKATKLLTVCERKLPNWYFAHYMRPRNFPAVFPLSDGAYFEMSVQMDYTISRDSCW